MKKIKEKKKTRKLIKCLERKQKKSINQAAGNWKTSRNTMTLRHPPCKCQCFMHFEL